MTRRAVRLLVRRFAVKSSCDAGRLRIIARKPTNEPFIPAVPSTVRRLSAALQCEIVSTDDAVERANFQDYDTVRLPDPTRLSF